MRIAVTGSHGLIGSALTARLEAAGHTVVKLVRSGAATGEVSWDPARGTIDSVGLGTPAVVVHLAGAGIGDHRWREQHKARVLHSRVDGTGLLARTISQLDRPPRVLVSASAVGYYGDRGDEELTEDGAGGSGFLADVCRQWEDATAPAAEAGIRVVRLRTGIVLSGQGGALRRQLPLFKLGLGGRLGSGRQYWSWIALADALGAIEFCMMSDDLHGPVNMTAPEPVTNAGFTRALARAVHRPAFLPVPATVLRLVMGREMANELLLSSQRAVPAALLRAGYPFKLADLDTALHASTSIG